MTAPSAPEPGPAPILVLVAPQDIVNIASAVRLAKNFGLAGIRLVSPEVFAPPRIEGIAHNTADLVARIEICGSLSEALRDTVYSVALTARGRAAKRTYLEPREAATEIVAHAEAGPVRVAGIGQGTEAIAVRYRSDLTSFRATQSAAVAKATPSRRNC